MTLLCLFPLFYCHVSLLNMTYYFPLLNDSCFGHSSQFSTPPSHTWHKCRHAASKIARHTGIIRSATSDVCKTTADLDRALRATRSFWQENPCPCDPSWSSLLQDYAASTSTFSPCLPPTYDDFYHAIVTSPDSAPGADGIPYAAWRVCPSISTTSLAHHFQRKVSPPTQALVFIPKADQGEHADNYRPLGLPNTCDRIVDRAAYTLFCQTLIGKLHPAQALLNLFRTWLFSNSWMPRMQPTVSFYLILPKLLSVLTLTG